MGSLLKGPVAGAAGTTALNMALRGRPASTTPDETVRQLAERADTPAMALLGLGPFVVLSTASFPLTSLQGDELGATRSGLQLANGLANAAYALCVVVAADLVQRVPARRLYLGCTVAAALGATAAALAPDVRWFGAGRVLHGGATAGAGGLVLTGTLLLGGSRPQAPHIQRWVDGDGPAYDSPPRAALLRGRARLITRHHAR